MIGNTCVSGATGRGGRYGYTRWAVVLCLLLGLAGVGSAQAANALQSIEHTALSGDGVQLTLTLAEPLAPPQGFRIENPARIAFDLPNTRSQLAQRNLQIATGVLESISTAEAGGRTRVVLQLAQMVPHEIRAEGNRLFIILQGPTATADADTAPRAATAQRGASIGDIDFRRGSDGTGRIIVTLSDPSVAIDLREDGDRLVANLLNTRIPQRLERRLDVTDFNTPVLTVDSRQSGNAVRLHIATRDHYEQMAYQTGNTLTIELKPITREERDRRARQEDHYSGERLSLNFQDIQVRSVLQLISDFTGLNVVVSDSVNGNITLRLENVPWDQALDIILKSRGLDQRRSGNVLMIGTADEIAAREQLRLEAASQIRTLEPLRAQFIQINYAKAADIADLLRNEDTSLLSERGTVAIDQRTNTLIVRDTERNMADIRDLIAQLDVAVRQVLIESRVVIASDRFTRDLGVRFGATRSGEAGGRSGTAGGTQPGNIGLGADQFGVPGGLLVDLPAATSGGSVGLAVGRIGSDLLQLELSAMETEGRGDIVSSPRVITANQQPATIEQGVEIPYEQATASGATSIAFKKAVLGLTVTPQITPDDRVLLNLLVSKDSQGENTMAGPAINTQSVNTQVLVDNGETVVLGGIYERVNNEAARRIPFFGELPLIGGLFRSRQLEDRRSELLVFVTPKILSDSLSAAQ